MQKVNITLELISKIKKGDKLAYKELFDTLYNDLVCFALRYIQDKDIAEEIVQEYFVQFWINKNKVEISSSPKSYFYRSIRNRSLNYLRDKKTDLSFETDLTLLTVASYVDDKNADDFSLLKSNVDKAINSLPEKCGRIFKLSREKQLSYKMIAEELDLSPKTVESQMGIALKKLREQLKPVLKNFVSILFLLKYFKNF